MIYRKQKGYDNFKCIADKCPKSCCIGWQIMIDEDSLAKYGQADGDFGHRLKNSIDYSEGSFIQHNTRCSMLNDNGLCDLQSTLGEGYLCNTCRMYPRHVEEFQDIREYSLSLSCPDVVRMILEPDYKFGFTETEDDVVDDSEEFEDFDFILFDKLEYAREKILEVALDTSLPFMKRLNIIVSSALKLQELFDEGELFEMDDISYSEEAPLSIDYLVNSFDALLDMEVLEEEWKDSISSAKGFWSDKESFVELDSNLENTFEKIFESLLFTYFCGSVYDGQIYARTMIAVQSTRWLIMLYEAAGRENLAPIIYLFSREVEHSDLNVNALIEYFESELE